jgi:hypothetical protein
MTIPPIDLDRFSPKEPDLAVVVLVALLLDAHRAGDDRAVRRASYRLKLLGWRVEPTEPLGPGGDP